MIVTLTERSPRSQLALLGGGHASQDFFLSRFLDVILLTESTRRARASSTKVGAATFPRHWHWTSLPTVFTCNLWRHPKRPPSAPCVPSLGDLVNLGYHHLRKRQN